MVSARREAGEDTDSIEAIAFRRRRPILFVALLLLGLVLAILVVGWTQRRPITERFVEQELERRGVRASYTIERISLHSQVVRNLVIGDPARPDLTARYAIIQMRIRLNGSIQVYRVVASGVRIRGELLDSGRVTFGDIDKLLPPPSGKPFTLPDMAIDLSDAQLALKTPYGPLGFAAVGRGNLSGGFRGRLAASGPALDTGACSLDALKANVSVAVDARRPRIVGPVSARAFRCPNSRLAIVQPRIDLDSRFGEGFDSFDGKGILSTSSAIAGANGLANMIARIDFKGDIEDAQGTIELTAQQARLASIVADRTAIEGRYRLWPKQGNLALAADYAATSAALTRSTLDDVLRPLESAGGTPVGPVAKRSAAALRRTAANFDAAGEIALVNLRGGGGVRIKSSRADGPDGATIRLSAGDGVTYYWPSGRIRVDGNIAMRGGGLPTAFAVLRQPRGGGPMNGIARIAPYSAGAARLVLAPVLFSGSVDGSTRVRTAALVDGPLAGGWVTGLHLPIDGRIGGPGGGFAFGRGCIDAGFTTLRTGGLQLRNARIPICPTGGAILAKRGSGPVTVGAVTRNLRLGGSLGRSPFALTARQARFSGSDRFDARGIAARFGNPRAPILIEADSVAGRLGGGGARGTLAGADVVIGKVPVGLEKGAGTWDFRNGALAIDGSATVFDRDPNPRFYPLKTDNLVFRLADDVVRADATLKTPVNGSTVTDVSIRHRLSSGDGNAVLDVPGLDFAVGGLQPDQITRLTQGAIALVDGSISGQGRIAWRGDGNVSSTGEFTTNDMDLAAAFGPVEGLSTTIHFTDLLGFETAPGQFLSVQSVNPGIEVLNGSLRYQILPGQLVKIERGEWPFMGGRLILEETILNFAKDSPKRLTFTVVGLDANLLVGSLNFPDIQATGIFDGALPLIFDDDGGRLVGGRLESRPPGGSLSYEGAINRANLGMFAEIAFDALRSLKFNSMIVRLDGDLAGEFATAITIDEVAIANNNSTQRFVKNLVRKVPFKFNVSIRGPFRSLIATARSTRDPRPVIRDVLPVPLDEIPGVVTEVRNRGETSEQTQTPVKDNVTVSPTPPKESEDRR